MKNIEFYRFLISLAKDLNRFYKKNLNKPFKAFNKGKGSNYDPVTIADKKFEKFIYEFLKFFISYSDRVIVRAFAFVKGFKRFV